MLTKTCGKNGFFLKLDLKSNEHMTFVGHLRVRYYVDLFLCVAVHFIYALSVPSAAPIEKLAFSYNL